MNIFIQLHFPIFFFFFNNQMMLPYGIRMLTYMYLRLHIILLSNEMKPLVFKFLLFIGEPQLGLFFSPFHRYEFHCESKKTLGTKIKCMLPLQKQKQNS